MKVTYIGHSGFLVETSGCSLLFDYYQGQIPRLRQDTPLFVFVSHSHSDHFNPEIFSIKGPDTIHYIISREISLRKRYNITVEYLIAFPERRSYYELFKRKL